MEFRPEIAHYECSLCGEKLQVLCTVQQEVFDEESQEMILVEVLDMDGEASFQLVLSHLLNVHDIQA